jgi:hypothetical protein
MAKDTVDEAIDSLKSGQFTSRRAAARHFDVNPGTIDNRREGMPTRQDAHAYRQKLSPKEEQLLLSWIQTEDLASASPTYARIRAMANSVY